ncbi:Uncharacterized protein DAT39_004276 [Clarias magur]|uniref:Uncharacterized protein n=1 Tax=Clarias magur TaxID=1594786 RepID=A0A8J4U4P4_CLAMG|nr:Uncharacterized protein DAT39_004276 [Clarias magur]
MPDSPVSGLAVRSVSGGCDVKKSRECCYLLIVMLMILLPGGPCSLLRAQKRETAKNSRLGEKTGGRRGKGREEGCTVPPAGFGSAPSVHQTDATEPQRDFCVEFQDCLTDEWCDQSRACGLR